MLTLERGVVTEFVEPSIALSSSLLAAYRYQVIVMRDSGAVTGIVMIVEK
jgi:hypothetical protein